MAQQGDHLNRSTGEIRIAATHVRSRRAPAAKGLSEVAKVDHVVVRQVQDYHSRGVIPVFRVGAPSAPRVRGSPYKNGRESKSYLNFGMTPDQVVS